MKTDLFQSYGHCWVFQMCWHIECSTFTASSFRIWNSSTGIPSPPLALFVVMLPKAYLTSHSRMSGSLCVITPSCLSGLWRSFLYVYIYVLCIYSICVCVCVCIYIYIYIHLQIPFQYRLLQHTEYSSLYHAVGPCFLPIIYIVLLLLSLFSCVRLCATP